MTDDDPKRLEERLRKLVKHKPVERDHVNAKPAWVRYVYGCALLIMGLACLFDDTDLVRRLGVILIAATVFGWIIQRVSAIFNGSAD